jgi:hypothetical protein
LLVDFIKDNKNLFVCKCNKQTNTRKQAILS